MTRLRVLPALCVLAACSERGKADDTAPGPAGYAECDADVDGAENLTCGLDLESHTLGWVAKEMLDTARERWAVDAELLRVGADIGADGIVGDEAYMLAYFRADSKGGAYFCDTASTVGCGPVDEDGQGLGAWTLDSIDVVNLILADDFPVYVMVNLASQLRPIAAEAGGTIPEDVPDDRGVYYVAWGTEKRFIDGVTGEVWFP